MADKPRTFTKEEKSQIIEHARSGVSTKEIGRQLNVDARKIHGVLMTAVNKGILQKLPPKELTPAQISMSGMTGTQFTPVQQAVTGQVQLETIPVLQEAQCQTQTPMNTPPPIQQPNMQPQPQQTQNGFDFRGAGMQGSFNYNGINTKFLIERITPHDGYMGSHPAPFEPDDLGRLYGAGTYKVTKQEPGKLPMTAELVIGEVFGSPRYPRQVTDRESGNRRREEEDSSRQAGGPYIPFGARYQIPGGSSAEAIVAAEAVKQLGQANERALKQSETAQSKGPDTFLQTFFDKQQIQWKQQQDIERERWQQETKDKETREERRRKEEEEKWQRNREDERLRHDREMERIRQEGNQREKMEREQRLTILEMEQKKIDLVKEEAKIREQIIVKDLERTREEMKLTRESLEARMISMQESVDEEIQKGRESIEKEHNLRMASLSKEHELRMEMLKLKEEIIGHAGTDDFSRMVSKVVEELGKTAKEVVDLKKLEAMSPEAHAAAIAQGTVNGNVSPPPQSIVSQTPKLQEGPVPARMAALQEHGTPANNNGNGNLNGNGNGKTESKDIIKEFLGSQEVKPIIQEWARHVQEGTTPAMFGNMFMEFMRDPEDHKLRKACHVFANYMSSRSWAHMFPALQPHLTEEELAIFSSEGAEDFYEVFRAFITESVKEYVEGFLIERARRGQEGKPAEAETEEANVTETSAS